MTGAPSPVKLRAMTKPSLSRPDESSAATFSDRVRDATELLESIVSDRGAAPDRSQRPATPASGGRTCLRTGCACPPSAGPCQQPAAQGGEGRAGETGCSIRPASGRSADRRYTPAPTSFRPSRSSSGRSTTRTSGKRSSRSTATSASRNTPPSIISTTRCARPARRSTSPSGPSWPTCGAGWRC